MSWVRSSFCTAGECVEVSREPDGWVSVRNSRRPARVVLFDPEEWAAFEAGVRAGEFGPAAGEAS